MNNLRLKISLPGTDPLVWREVVVHPDTELNEMHDILQAVMDWDDYHMHIFRDSQKRVFDPEEGTYYTAVLRELLPRKGSKLWYVYDFGDNWEHLIEMVGKVPEEDRETPYLIGGANAAPPEDSGGISGYRYKLDVLADPAHPEYEETLGWMTGFGDVPFDPRFFDLEDTALYLRECMEGVLGELLEDYEEGALGEGLTFLDLDFGRERKIDAEWVEQEFGLRLTDDDIRGEIPEITEFIQRAEQVDDPTPFLAKAEKLHEKYPENLEIGLALAAMYSFLEKDLKARRILASLPPPPPEQVLYHLREIMFLEEDDQFVAKVLEMPQPLSLTNMPAGKGGKYHTEEFLLFEEIAIRLALCNEQLEEAVDRLDRLVRAGFLHKDLRPAALMIAGLQIAKVQELMAKHRAQPDLPVPPQAKPVSERTQEILDHSMQDVLQLFRSGGLAEADDWFDEGNDDYPDLSLAHSTRKPQQPYVAEKKVGRNDPCPCGSGKKYKKCCG